MLLQVLERRRSLRRILEQLPDSPLEILRAPSQPARNRLVDPRADEGEDEEDEDQPKRNIKCRKVQHGITSDAIRRVSHVAALPSMATRDAETVSRRVRLRFRSSRL